VRIDVVKIAGIDDPNLMLCRKICYFGPYGFQFFCPLNIKFPVRFHKIDLCIDIPEENF